MLCLTATFLLLKLCLLSATQDLKCSSSTIDWAKISCYYQLPPYVTSTEPTIPECFLLIPFAHIYIYIFNALNVSICYRCLWLQLNNSCLFALYSTWKVNYNCLQLLHTLSGIHISRNIQLIKWHPFTSGFQNVPYK